VRQVVTTMFTYGLGWSCTLLSVHREPLVSPDRATRVQGGHGFLGVGHSESVCLVVELEPVTIGIGPQVDAPCLGGQVHLELAVPDLLRGDVIWCDTHSVPPMSDMFSLLLSILSLAANSSSGSWVYTSPWTTKSRLGLLACSALAILAASASVILGLRMFLVAGADLTVSPPLKYRSSGPCSPTKCTPGVAFSVPLA